MTGVGILFHASAGRSAARTRSSSDTGGPAALAHRRCCHRRASGTGDGRYRRQDYVAETAGAIPPCDAITEANEHRPATVTASTRLLRAHCRLLRATVDATAPSPDLHTLWTRRDRQVRSRSNAVPCLPRAQVLVSRCRPPPPLQLGWDETAARIQPEPHQD